MANFLLYSPGFQTILFKYIIPFSSALVHTKYTPSHLAKNNCIAFFVIFE